MSTPRYEDLADIFRYIFKPTRVIVDEIGGKTRYIFDMPAASTGERCILGVRIEPNPRSVPNMQKKIARAIRRMKR